MIGILKTYGLPLSGIFAAIVVLQWVLACNLCNTRRLILDARAGSAYQGRDRGSVKGAAPIGPSGVPTYAAAVQGVHPPKKAYSGALRRAQAGKPKQKDMNELMSQQTYTTRA